MSENMIRIPYGTNGRATYITQDAMLALLATRTLIYWDKTSGHFHMYQGVDILMVHSFLSECGYGFSSERGG